MMFTETCKLCGEEFEPENMGERVCDDCKEDEDMPKEGYYPRNIDIENR